MSNELAETAYCPHCDAERSIRITVPWQDDICTTCGKDVSTRSD